MWGNTLQRAIARPGLGLVPGASAFACACEVQENTKGGSVRIPVSVHLLQFQINHSSRGHDLVKDEIGEGILYLQFEVRY